LQILQILKTDVFAVLQKLIRGHCCLFNGLCFVMGLCVTLIVRARPMYRHTDIYQPIWRCCRCIVSAKFHRYISAIFAHKSVALLLCMERSVTQVTTSSLILVDYNTAVEMVMWQVQSCEKKQGFRLSLQFTQCNEEAASNLPALKA